MSKFTNLLAVACCIFGSSLITRSLGQESTKTILSDPCAQFSNGTCLNCVNNGCVYLKENDQLICRNDSFRILDDKLVANTTEGCEEKFPASNATTLSPDTTTTDTTTPTTTGSSTTTLVTTTPPETTTPTPTTEPTNTTTESPTSSTTNSTTPITSTSPSAPTTPTTPSAPTTPTTPSIPTSSTVPSTTTLNPSTTASTTTTTAAPHPERHFDAASFFGGFVLLLGLLAIGYLGLKFYRSRTERNYHTLP